MRLLVLSAVLAASVATAAPAALPTVILDQVPWVKQRPDFCGEACVEMAARRLGKTYDQDAVFAETGLDPALGRGAYTPDLVRAVRRLGFAPPSIYTLVDARAPARGLAAELARLHADLARGIPSIVCMHYNDQPHTTEHFRLVVGFDAETDQIVYQEPAEDAGEYRRMDRVLFEKLWQLPSSDPSKRVLVRIALVPGKLADPAPAAAEISQAAYVQHVMTLRERLHETHLDRLAVRVTAPFVVAGPARDIKARATKLLAGATPDGIVDVFVFEATGFARGVEALRGRAPATMQGFYSAADHAVYINLGANLGE